MSKFLSQPEDGIIIRGNGNIKVRKAEQETEDFDSVEPEAQDPSR